MGNSQPGNRRKQSQKEEIWSGPFSDPELANLQALFTQLTTTDQGGSTNHQAFRQVFEVTVPSQQTPPELARAAASFGQELYLFSIRSREEPPLAGKPNPLRLNEFLKTVAGCMRGSSQTVARSLFGIFDVTSCNKLSESQLATLFFLLLCMGDDQLVQNAKNGGATTAEPAEKTDTNAQKYVQTAQALAKSAIAASCTSGDPEHVSCDEFVAFLDHYFPLLYSIFMTWMAQTCLVNWRNRSYMSPVITNPSTILSRADFILLGSMTKSLQGQLDRLYTSTQDGLSFNRLCHHILGYAGSTLIVCEDTDGDVFGMYCDQEWKESSRFFGGNGCFLFRFQPELTTYRVDANSSREHFMYLNTKGFALPRGLGMGGDTNRFRVFFDEDFENCYTAREDLTFENGHLSKKPDFVIETLEVWGCGGEASAAMQEAHRKEMDALITKARQVDKAKFLGSGFDKEFLLSQTFAHQANQQAFADDES